MTNSRIGKVFLSAAIMLTFAFGFTAIAHGATRTSGSHARARTEKKLTSSQAKAFVRQLTTEMNIVLYDVINVPGVKEQRDAFNKKFAARGSMKGKTKTQIAAMFMEDVNSSFTEAATKAEIKAHVDNLLAK